VLLRREVIPATRRPFPQARINIGINRCVHCLHKGHKKEQCFQFLNGRPATTRAEADARRTWYCIHCKTTGSHKSNDCVRRLQNADARENYTVHETHGNDPSFTTSSSDVVFAAMACVVPHAETPLNHMRTEATVPVLPPIAHPYAMSYEARRYAALRSNAYGNVRHALVRFNSILRTVQNVHVELTSLISVLDAVELLQGQQDRELYDTMHEASDFAAHTSVIDLTFDDVDINESENTRPI
jgi:hypothetical protein